MMQVHLRKQLESLYCMSYVVDYIEILAYFESDAVRSSQTPVKYLNLADWLTLHIDRSAR